MQDINGFAKRVAELAVRFNVAFQLSPDGLSVALEEAHIPVKTFRVFQEYQGSFSEIAMGREPAFPIVRLFLGSLVERGTPSIDITLEMVNRVADFFGYHWTSALTGTDTFLFGIHIGSHIELEWE